jgi:signal peptidase I
MTPRGLFIGRSLGLSLARGLAVGALLLAGSQFLLMPIRAHGISMMPTYEEGQFIFVNRLAYRVHGPRRGDVVAITLRGGEAVLVKRIVALGGERVRIERGQVVVNGVPLDEPYVRHRIPWNLEETLVGTNEVFVIGDNRSMPAELHDFGSATQDRILGPAIF